MRPKQETTPFTMYWPAHWYVFLFFNTTPKKKNNNNNYYYYR